MDNLSGLRIKRSRFNLSHRKIFDARYYQAIPILYYFGLPGDVVTLGANIFVRSMPMLAPLMNKNEIDVRYFCVPLRLVEKNFEKVVTGSSDGKILSSVPSLPKWNDSSNGYHGTNKISKYSFFDYLGVPVGAINSDFPVCNYVPKAFSRIIWDYYRDENLNTESSYEDFEAYYHDYILNIGYYDYGLDSTNLQKNYFTSALPWQLKGEIPTFTFDVSGFADFSNAVVDDGNYLSTVGNLSLYQRMEPNAKGGLGASKEGENPFVHRTALVQTLNQNELNFEGLSVNASQLRSMFAETRIMERCQN